MHNQYGKHGTLSVSAVGINISNSNKTIGNSGSNIPTWGINKVGWIDQNTENNGIPTKIYWDIVINPQGNALKNVKVTDTIGDNQSFDEGSVKVYTINYSNDNNSSRTGTISANIGVNGNQVTFDIGNVNTAIEIEYETNITNINVDSGNLWSNEAEVTVTNTDAGTGSTNWTKTKDVATVNWGTGGTVKSYAGKITVTKVDSTNESILLPGAEFELENKNGSIVREHLITNSNGKVEIDNLPDGEYRLIETKAPAGYQLNSTPIEINISNNDNHIVSTTVKDLPISSNKILSSSSSSSDSLLSNSNLESSSSMNNTSVKKSISTKNITGESSSNKMNSKNELNSYSNSINKNTVTSTVTSSSGQVKSKNNSTIHKKDNKQILPQTGETNTRVFVTIGIMILILMETVIILKKY